jgi:hypothetical protein
MTTAPWLQQQLWLLLQHWLQLWQGPAIKATSVTVVTETVSTLTVVIVKVGTVI